MIKNITSNSILATSKRVLSANSFSQSTNASNKVTIDNDKKLLKINQQLFSYTYSYFSNTSTLDNREWNKTLTNAEKIVGYPTSFLNLRYLVSDEVANFANLLRKLMKTKHPLIKMARRLISNGSDNDSKRSLQINGLLVLLIAKAAGIPKENKDILDVQISDGIHQSQRCLAEITEMIYMGSLIHKGILDLKLVDQTEYKSMNQGILDLKLVDQTEYKSMDQGNKLAVLCGDYLLASACTNLSKLRNTQVVDLMSQVIADISQGIFINNKNPKFTFLKIWYENINSASSSLLANSAKSAMLLVSHSPKLQETAWEFAKNLDISHKIWSDLHEFKKDESVFNNPDTILNAIYKDKYKPFDESKEKIETKPNFLGSSLMSSLFSNENKLNIDKNLVQNILDDCRHIFVNHHKLALDNLDRLQNEYSEKDAIASLKSILNVMKNTI